MSVKMKNERLEIWETSGKYQLYLYVNLNPDSKTELIENKEEKK